MPLHRADPVDNRECRANKSRQKPASSIRASERPRPARAIACRLFDPRQS
jgi:hypothetical protein